jgi:hypothetical protein
MGPYTGPNYPECIITILSPHPTFASGDFDVYVINFVGVAPGPANILIYDDGNEFSWSGWPTQQPGNVVPIIPVAYTQAGVNVVPSPAVGWLLAPAFGVIGWLKSRRVSRN